MCRRSAPAVSATVAKGYGDNKPVLVLLIEKSTVASDNGL
jgi:hypothetical protein